MKRLEGRIAAVTGASRGMGRHFAAALAAEGARVALLARPSDKLTEAAASLGDAARAIACDVSDPDSVRAAFAAIEREFGGLDILVNNAGVSLLGLIEEVTDRDVRTEIGINLMGPIFTCREALPMLRRSPHADIVNVSSESARLPWPYMTVYSATKAGLEAFSAGLRHEVRKDLIRVTALRAGHTTGSELARNWDDAAMAKMFATVMETGHAKMAGTTGTPPEAMAAALVSILTLPREVDADLIELRPTAP